MGKVKVYLNGIGQLLKADEIINRIRENVSVLPRTFPEQHNFSEMTTRGPKRKVIADRGGNQM